MKKILFLTPVYDEGMSDGLNLRIVNIVKFLSSQYKVSLLCFTEPKFKDLVNFEKIESVNYDKSVFRKISLLLGGKTAYNIYNQKKVIAKLKEIEKDYDIFFSFYISTALPLLALKTGKPVLIDLVDCLWLHMKEAKGISFGRKILYELNYRKVRKLELYCVKNSTFSFITSDVEKQNLVKYCESCSGKIIVVSNGVECRSGYKETERFTNKIGFLGNMGYYPNQIAAKRLVTKILPLLSTDVYCYIIGAKPTPDIKTLESENVKVTGFVEDINEILNELDMVILPMETASGVQNKLITSLSYGKIVITSKRVDTGTFDFKNNENIIFAESDQEYAVAIENIYKDLSLAKKIEKGAFVLMQKNSWNNILNPMAESLLQI